MLETKLERAADLCKKLLGEVFSNLAVLKLGSGSLLSALEKLGDGEQDLENTRFVEDSEERYEELSQGLEDATDELAEHQSLVEVELLLARLSHCPLGDFQDDRAELVFAQLNHEGVEALDDGILHFLADWDSLLVGLIGQGEALLEEGDELLTVLLHELGRQVLEDGAEEL